MVDLKDIQAAHKGICGHIHRTPLVHSNSFSLLTGADVFMKAENLQKTGSFKVRGAFNRLSGLAGRKVIAASMGNHAQGVAFAASLLDIRPKIVMPVVAPIVKQEATKGYGAELVLHGESFQEALEFALSHRDYVFIHAFDDEEIIAGQGTIGIEIAEELEGIDAVLVPVGGGGLIAGISVAIKSLTPKTKVIGVQTKAAPSATVSFKDKRITSHPPANTIADGIAVGRVGEKTFEIISRSVDDMILVDEESIAMAILLFLERKKLVVEGAGAAPLAALIRHKKDFAGKRVVIVVSGGNIDFTLIDRIIHKGLVTSGRIAVFEVTIDDLPGRLHALTGIIASRNGNILDIAHDRLASGLAIGETRVVFTVETRGPGHLRDILSAFAKQGLPARLLNAG